MKLIEKAKHLGLKTKVCLKNHMPEILHYGGLVAIAGGAVIGAINTYNKLDSTIEEIKVEREKLEQDKDEYDYRRRLTTHYISAVGKFGKIYALPASLIAVGVYANSKGFTTMKDRAVQSAALANAYATAYQNLKEQVREKHGRTDEIEMIHGEENGKKEQETIKSEKRPAQSFQDPNAILFAPYTSDAYRCKLDGSPDYHWNFMFLENCERTANGILSRQGYITKNQILNLLGIKPTADGNIAGLVKTMGKYVSFNIANIESDPNVYNFFTGREDCIWLELDLVPDITRELERALVCNEI